MRFLLSLLLSSLVLPPFSTSTAAETPSVAALQELGGADFQNWQGLKLLTAGEAELAMPGSAVFHVPAGAKGWHRPTDMELEYDGVIDARPWYGVRFQVKKDRPAPLHLTLTVRIPAGQERHDFLDAASAQAVVPGQGWQTVTVPFASFDYARGQGKFLKFLSELTIQASNENDPAPDTIQLRQIRLVKAAAIHLETPIQSKPANAQGEASYDIAVTNCTDGSQFVALTLEKSGWEGMPAELTPNLLTLASGETKNVTIKVTVPKETPAGAHETQTLLATLQNGSGSTEKLVLTTLQPLPFPFLVHDAAGWDEVRDKVRKYDWAKDQAAEIIKKADAWQVPEPYANNRAPDGTLSVFKSYIEGEMIRCAIAWRLTGDAKYAEKLALLLRRFSNPENGYPKTLHASSQGIPQEGGFFEGVLVAYEAAAEAGLLNDADKQQIEHTFRLYIGTIQDGQGDGGVSNWSVFNLAPAAMCALALQDLALFDSLMNGPCGLVDHLRYGTMDDGWWYEMSLAYNLGCAQAYTNLALAARPFGIDLLNEKFPAAVTKKVGLRPFEFENFEGMAFGKYGPQKQNTITLKQMWDGITLYPDYRGVMFGMGDGHEHTVGGGPFELAYYAYRDPAYASIIKQGGKRDLLYGVPELPANTPMLYTQSGFSDNAGIAVLRSQTPAREPREQIQAAVKYGTHGGYHGHFDRISLLSLMRYGRSFFNPETSWFGYGNYMYKWWTQTSLAHNMVVVDAKQQEPQECRRLLFHSGTMMQALAVETNARWSNPPYFGGYEQLEKVKAGDASFVPIPETHPKPGEVTDYTEPVRQRRLTIGTDDYVILVDDLQAAQEHTYDHLMHLRGAVLASSAQAKLLRHDAQFDASPLGSGQFITNVDRYQVSAPAIIDSIHRIAGNKRADDSFARTDDKNWETGGAKSLSEPGVLKIDEHVLWPQNPEIAIGNYAESWNVNKKVTYTVSGDGKTLASGTFGAWILGSGNVDVDVTGIDKLELQTSVTRGKDTRNTLFWADARVVLRGGQEIFVNDLTGPQDSIIRDYSTNIINPPSSGLDYEGGPVVIAGNPATKSAAAEPQDAASPGIRNVILKGLDVVRFKATIGGDWPVGNQEQLRKTVSIRQHSRDAHFLTLLEPYENESVIKSATATGPDKLRVELSNGTVQDIEIRNFSGSNDRLEVSLVETRAGEIIRQENTAGAGR